MKENLTTGATAGILSTLITGVLEWGLSLTGIIPLVTYQYISLLILPSDLAVSPAVEGATVILSGAAASVVFGMLNAVILMTTGRDYWALKGAAWGGVLFIMHVSLIPKLWEPRILPILSSPEVIVWELVDRLGWGLINAYLFIALLARQRHGEMLR